ncbi:MAG: SdrD B-like domain-containing protein [Acidimicrobiia bacterium]
MPQISLPARAGHRHMIIAVAATLLFSMILLIPGAATADAQTATASLSLEKSTNGHDADAPPGPTISIEDPVLWAFEVTNTGDLTVSDILVTDVGDSVHETPTIVCDGQQNGSITLDPTESITCSATGVSWFSSRHTVHSNTATATGSAATGVVTATDSSHYTPLVSCPYTGSGDNILLNIIANSNGDMLGNGLNPSSVGPINVDLPAGTYTVRWASYDAHTHKDFDPHQTEEIWYLDAGGFTSDNTIDIPNDVDLASGTMANKWVVDSPQSSVTVRHGGPSGKINSVTAICALLIPDGPTDPSISIDKWHSGDTPNEVDTQDVAIGGEPTFKIRVTNTGADDLENVEVTDPLAPGCDNLIGDLASGAHVDYDCTGEPADASFVNEATVEGKVVGYQTTVTDTDTSSVVVLPPAGGELTILKLVDDLDGNWVPTATYPNAITDATWQITVTNTTAELLDNVELADANAPACVTAFGEAMTESGWDNGGVYHLPPMESVTFECSSTIVASAPAINTAIATAVDQAQRPVGPVESSATITRVAASGTIGDTVWYDTNANGKQDNGEKGIAGAKVRLTFPDNTTAETTTNANGLYLFSALEPGTYTAEVILSSIAVSGSGTLKLTTPGSFTISLAEGQSYLDADFGVVETLPVTGIPSRQILIVALGLLVAGTVGVVSTNRRDELGADIA